MTVRLYYDDSYLTEFTANITAAHRSETARAAVMFAVNSVR